MATRTDDCAARRAELRERALEGLSADAAPAVLRDHLAGCPGCRRYAEGLRLAPALFPATGLYTPDLRRRTLAATADAPEPLGASHVFLPVAAAVTGFGVSVALPFWLLSRLFDKICPTGVCAMAGAAAVFLLLGLCASGAIAVPALRRNHTGKAAASWTIWR